MSSAKWQSFVSGSMCSHTDVTMGAMAFQITSLTIVCSTVYSGANQRKYQSSTSLDFVRGIYQSPVNSPQRASNAETIWWRHHKYKAKHKAYSMGCTLPRHMPYNTSEVITKQIPYHLLAEKLERIQIFDCLFITRLLKMKRVDKTETNTN